ncbi:riboflavin synthase [Chlamydiales bacterium]|nr:riboflavin synthase [Chlamydiales bacterium]
MFTGIIQKIGKTISIKNENGKRHIEITSLDLPLELGCSISINGCCLTATQFNNKTFTVTAVEETLNKTTLGNLKSGDFVNLEPALRFNQGIDGHLVQGHVDGVGEIVEYGDLLKIKADDSILNYLVSKGSVTIDGISLTVVEVKNNYFTIALIPHTKDVTTLGKKVEGSLVNIEVDIIGKYVEKFMLCRRGDSTSPKR